MLFAIVKRFLKFFRFSGKDIDLFSCICYDENMMKRGVPKMKRSVLVAAGAAGAENYEAALTLLGAEAVVRYGARDGAGFDALLLTGGGDVDPVRYGEENTASVGIDPLRDACEFSLIAAFVREKKPILGICRGLQILNVAFGGTLIQHLPTADRIHRGEHDRVHAVRAVAGEFPARLYGERFSVNSAHHQGIGIPGEGMLPVAFSEEDGVIEAVRHTSLPILAVQFHPERMMSSYAGRRAETADGGAVFREFLSLF